MGLHDVLGDRAIDWRTHRHAVARRVVDVFSHVGILVHGAEHGEGCRVHAVVDEDALRAPRPRSPFLFDARRAS